MSRSRPKTRRKPRCNPRGVLDVHAEGYGFVKTPEGEFFVSAKLMGGAFDGDLVEVAPVSAHGGRSREAFGGRSGASSRRPHARVVRVIDRAHDTIVGRYEVAEPFGVVVPADPKIKHDIFTMRADAPDVPDGALVRVRIATFPGKNTAATGFVEEVIGDADADVSIDLIVARHKLETAFSAGALAEARAAAVDEEAAFAEGYRDLRDRLIVTIDPVDAKDFDDAVSLVPLLGRTTGSSGAAREPGTPSSRDSEGSHAEYASPLRSCRPEAPGSRSLTCPHPEAEDFLLADAVRDANVSLSNKGGMRSQADHPASRAAWRLGVHIADVSHYVPWGSSIDLDARRRATSVYLADRVIPMLPEELSNNVCSLRPGVPRRTMTVDLYLDDDANVLSVDAYPAIIESKRRFAYEEVQAVLEAAPDAPTLDARIADMLRGLSRLANKRMAARIARGGLDFATAEAKARLDADGRPVGIDVRRRTDATGLIEEAMILANEAVARFLENRHIPGIFRVHDRPDEDNLVGLVPVFQEFSWWGAIDAERFAAADPHALAAVLDASAGKPEEELVSMLLLRAQKRAVYKPSCDGHYGLALDAYAHFTSPIRRYPDLVVHRMLKAALVGKPKDFADQARSLRWVAEHSSDMERVADAAARESQETKIIEYLERFVGTAFSAVVSGVATYGIYARLDNTAEGFVPVRSLGDEFFSFDPQRHCLTGADTGRRFRLGQRVAVRIHAADPATRTLELRLAGPSSRSSVKGSRT